LGPAVAAPDEGSVPAIGLGMAPPYGIKPPGAIG
jgi:hypothetical protein